MADQEEDSTIKLRIGQITLEYPERKARKELNRIRAQLQRNLSKAREFLDEVGLSQVVPEGVLNPQPAPSAQTGVPTQAPILANEPVSASITTAMDLLEDLTHATNIPGAVAGLQLPLNETNNYHVENYRDPPVPYAQNDPSGLTEYPLEPLPSYVLDNRGSFSPPAPPEIDTIAQGNHPIGPASSTQAPTTPHSLNVDPVDDNEHIANASTNSTIPSLSTDVPLTSSHIAVSPPFSASISPTLLSRGESTPSSEDRHTPAILSQLPSSPQPRPSLSISGSNLKMHSSGPLVAPRSSVLLEPDNVLVDSSGAKGTISQSHSSSNRPKQRSRYRNVNIRSSRISSPVSQRFQSSGSNVSNSEREIMEPESTLSFFNRTKDSMATFATAVGMLYPSANVTEELGALLSLSDVPVAHPANTNANIGTNEGEELNYTVNRMRPAAQASSSSFARDAFSVAKLTHDRLMATVFGDISTKGTLPDYNRIIQACLQSESAFNHLAQHFLTQEEGRQHADSILCTMQQMLDTSRAHVGDSALQLLRRTMLKLSMKCQVIPSLLFQRNVEYTENLPRYGGSFADVFFGSLAGKEVALKRLRLFQIVDQTQYWKNLCREALMWRQLHHPFVLPFLGLNGNPEDGAVYMISPWMGNGSLSRYLHKNISIDPYLKRSWVSQIASGLRYLHENSVVHGDLRGANILLDHDHRAYLADFGLAKLADAGQSTMGISTWQSGAIRWMPPEVLEGGHCTCAGDVYSFACVCLEITSGQCPFPQFTKDMQVINWVIAGNTPEWPQTGDAELDALRDVVRPCWRHGPARRPLMKNLRV